MATPNPAAAHQVYQAFPKMDAPIGRATPDGDVIIDYAWYRLLIWLWQLAGGQAGQTLQGAVVGAQGANTNTVEIMSTDGTSLGYVGLGDQPGLILAVPQDPPPDFILPGIYSDMVSDPPTQLGPDVLAFGTPPDGPQDLSQILGFAQPLGLQSANLSQLLFSQFAAVTVANSVAETTLIGAGRGSLVLPANYFQPGRTLKLAMFGFHSATGNPTIRHRVYLGSTVVLDTGAVTSGNSTNAIWDIRAQIVCASIGAGGTLLAQGFYTESAGGTNLFGMVNTAPVTFDTTAAATLNFTVTWGTASASNTITMTNFALNSEIPA